MGEHPVLYVDRLAGPSTVHPVPESSSADSSGPPSPASAVKEPTNTASTDPSSFAAGPSRPASDEVRLDYHESFDDEGEPLIQMAECRICQEEDSLKNLENPCACSGSLKYAHRKCVQHWCNEKGDIICEICHQPYQPGYTAPPQPEETAIDIGEGWTISGAPLELDPRLLAIAESDSRFLDSEYEEFSSSNASGIAFCRSAALILMALLLLRHALSVSDADADADDDDTSAFFSLFLLRAAGFLLPCYIMVWAISILQQRRQRQEAALAATQVAFVIQSGQHRGLPFVLDSGPSDSSRQSGTMLNSQPETV